ncbi:MAG: alcohol dehydrogenase catalytic domain-containing protein [Anaerolineaceae bacterium]|nr:alcohol dehydrogenase catalytic domain-containing protein [Anaerolineaceae bacterium]
MPKGKFETYREGQAPVKKTNRLWPLYGAGLENMGKDGKFIEKSMPSYGPDELLVRHDACGLCFSDIKIIKLGEEHPRIYRKMKENPVVLGHEVSLTVVGVGEKLQGQYRPGDRFILQADIVVNGVGYAYGYEIQGGLSEYNVIDQRVLNGDNGNYLIPIKPQTGYAESALVEPWACVIAAYYLQYRTTLKDGGTAWFIGPETRAYSFSQGFDEKSHPAVIKLTRMDGALGTWLRQQAEALGIKVVEINELPEISGEPVAVDQADDIILLSPSADLIEKTSQFLAFKGIVAFTAEDKLARSVNIDVGRIHYNRWVFVGGTETDIVALYSHTPVRSALKKSGKAMFVGAGGPMGRMHVQHAIETANPPGVIVCSDVSDDRLRDLDESYAAEAREKGIEWLCVNPTKKDEYEKVMRQFRLQGFDDIIMLAPIPAVISDAARWLGSRGVMNIFAGVARGTTAQLDLNDAIFKNVRVIGHSASSIDDMVTMLNEVEAGQLSTNRSVAAVGSLEAVKDGLQALMDATYPGKVVIFPNIKPLPLTNVQDLKNILPEVYVKLKNGREWTKEAEQAFLEAMLE